MKSNQYTMTSGHRVWMMVLSILVFTAIAVTIPACIDEDDGTGPVLNLPRIQMSDMAVTEEDDDVVFSADVQLTGDNQTNAIVSFAVVPGEAKALDDYKILTSGPLKFAPGETTKSISFEIIGDEGKEAVETFEIRFYGPQNCFLEKQEIVVTITDDDDLTQGLAIPSGGATSPLSYDGYTLVWQDEFDGETLNTNDWTFEMGNGCPNLCGWGNNELEYYREENTSIVNGHLVITAKRQAFGGSDYTSSRIITKGKQQFKFGRIDIRAALPEGKGIWPALWMLGSNIDASPWPACGEIDIMELTGDLPNRVVSTVHYGANISQHQYNSVSKFAASGDSYQDRFHVYSMNWENNLIEFMVDGEVFHTVTPASLNGQPYPFNKHFFFIMNLAVGGNWPGAPDSSTKFPQHLIVDYVRVFQK